MKKRLLALILIVVVVGFTAYLNGDSKPQASLTPSATLKELTDKWNIKDTGSGLIISRAGFQVLVSHDSTGDFVRVMRDDLHPVFRFDSNGPLGPRSEYEAGSPTDAKTLKSTGKVLIDNTCLGDFDSRVVFDKSGIGKEQIKIGDAWVSIVTDPQTGITKVRPGEESDAFKDTDQFKFDTKKGVWNKEVPATPPPK